MLGLTLPVYAERIRAEYREERSAAHRAAVDGERLPGDEPGVV